MKNKYPRLLTALCALILSVGSLWADRVTQEDAALVAANFFNAPDTTQTDTTQAAQAPGRNRPLRRVALAEEEQYYVYANADGNGWVMVAANDVVQPILAYSDEGEFRTDKMPTNVTHWLKGYNKQIKYAEENNVEATEEVQNEWKALRRGVRKAKAAVVVSPLIKTTWDQDNPYWNLCPSKNGSKCYTGCVATAMAQVMNYHQWPVKGTGSHSITYNGNTYTANFGTTTYDWANMKNSYSSSTLAQKTAVATLMFHCGVAVDMSYGTASEGGSGAYTIDYNGYWSGKGTMCAETALTTFFGYKSSTIKGYYRNGGSGMKKWTESEWIAMLKAELDASRPIMYAGGDSEGETGHSFVCDGYDSESKFHFNWGWSGSCDGYYTVNSLIPAESGSGGGNGDYSYDQDVIVGIIPDKTDLPKYNVTWSVKGSTTTVEYTEGEALVLPSNPDDCSGTNGKKFVGWTASSSVSGSAPTDLFTTAGSKTVTGNITYYAVFATASGSGGGSTKSYSFNITASDFNTTSYAANNNEKTTTAEASDASTIDVKWTSYQAMKSGTNIQFQKNAGYIYNSTDLGTIKSVTVTSSAGSFTTYYGTSAQPSSSTTVGGGYFQIKAGNATGTVSIIAVTFEKSAGSGTTTYSAYSLTCDPPCTSTPTMSFTNDEVTKMVNDASYTQTVTISGEGSGQTVTYNSSDKTIATVNNSGVVTLKGKVGQTVITASVEASGTYCSNSAEYTLTVTAAPINVTLNYNGTSTTLNNQPNPYTLPTTGDYVAPMCSGDWTFAGWYGSTYSKSTTAPTYITQLTAPGAAYAVYKNTETSGGSTSGSKTFTFSEIAEAEGWLNGVAQTEVVKSPVTITASGGANDGKYYTSDNTWRMYNGGTVSISVASGTVTSVTSTPSKTFTINNGVATLSCTETIKFTAITVAYTVSGSSTTYYATSPSCTPTTTYTVIWKVCGNAVKTETYAEGAALELPPTPGDNAGKSFAGWIASPSYTNKTTAPTYVTAGGAVNADVIYYAVFH